MILEKDLCRVVSDQIKEITAIKKELSDIYHQLAISNELIRRLQDDSHSASATKPKAKVEMARMANTSNYNKQAAS